MTRSLLLEVGRNISRLLKEIIYIEMEMLYALR